MMYLRIDLGWYKCRKCRHHGRHHHLVILDVHFVFFSYGTPARDLQI